jgi:hypothetical protein
MLVIVRNGNKYIRRLDDKHESDVDVNGDFRKVYAITVDGDVVENKFVDCCSATTNSNVLCMNTVTLTTTIPIRFLVLVSSTDNNRIAIKVVQVWRVQ